MTKIDFNFKEVVTSNTVAAQAIDDGYRRLEISHNFILEQIMDDTAYAIGNRIQAESMAYRRAQKETA